MICMSGCSRRTFNLLVCGVTAELWACGTSLPTVTASGNLVTLPFAQFPMLLMPGGGVVVAVAGGFPIAVVRTGDTTAVALSATCTHAGCTLTPEPNRLHCDCHDANFDFTGAVLSGPTIIPLPVYTATPGNDAVVVDLT
jgi:Rieske Fe-S protein